MSQRRQQSKQQPGRHDAGSGDRNWNPPAGIGREHPALSAACVASRPRYHASLAHGICDASCKSCRCRLGVASSSLWPEVAATARLVSAPEDSEEDTRFGRTASAPENVESRECNRQSAGWLGAGAKPRAMESALRKARTR